MATISKIGRWHRGLNMATDEERLVVSLEARIRDFEKNFQKAERTGTRTYQQLVAGSSRATRMMEQDAIRSSTRINQAFATVSTRVGAFGKAFGIGAFATLSGAAFAVIAPILSVAAALDKTKRAMDEFSAISDSAKATGLDAEFFQVLAHQSELGGVAVDQLSGALETFSKNAGLAAEGKGKMVKALQALNPELLKNILAATTQEERVRLAADAIDAAGSASEKAALSATLFGDAGTRLVEVFSGGSAAIDATAKSARDLGLIIDRDVIARTEELGDQLDTATKVINAEFSKALVDLAPLMVDAARLAGDVAAAISRIVDRMRDLENQSTTGLNTQLSTIGGQRLELENQILELQDKQRENAGALFGGFENKTLDGEIAARKQQIDELGQQEKSILDILGSRKPSEPLVRPASTDDDSGPSPSTGGKASRNSEAEAAIREAEAVKELIADLEFERSLLSMTEEQRRAAVISRQAGAAATEEQRAQIIALNEALHQEEEAQKRATEASEFFKDAAYDSFKSLIPQIETGNAALDSFINKLAEAAAQALLLGEGPLAGLFGGGLGSLFGGRASDPWAGMRSVGVSTFAGGGVSDRPAIFGEAGPEAAVPLPDGRRIPVDLRGAGSEGSTSVQVGVEVSVADDGALIAYVTDVSQKEARSATTSGIKEYNKTIPDRIKQVNQNPRKR
ncbi:hypothetical protein [Rhizobium herbae]|uniref:Bacteriophage tail tape measure N-terminal domain-containing protein n=1 Tax=Rhizobium herbae TaxID=508661 RepID=A0ABS4EG03_9HYPH|nr:hypothetical protein [Rhizobium herbae]MBP1856863.1 hypothetical protein [Rhizobium herbae]